ncbi:MAG: quinolinate synthase NadA [Chloroflexota bacterium]|nr:quinolinate synthase NadA [Chloroflexota bacterium]
MGSERYQDLSDEEVVVAIEEVRGRLGDKVTILGHHYQRDEVIEFADYRGDSLALSRRAAQAEKARYIVFCGVYFMAETAAILCKPEQQVVQPVMEALCPMARMASAAQAEVAWSALTSVWGDDVVPITYQNSVGELKAFVGERGGSVCTSSNAERLFAWGFERKNHILFMPDQHLGTNSALAMGIPEEEIGVWNPADPPDPQTLASCRVVVWKGHCYVHTGFTVKDVESIRDDYPDALIVVHPECRHEVVAVSDATGSTAGILEYVDKAPAGSTIGVGTEWHFVNRLQHEYRNKNVIALQHRECRDMAMTRMRDLLYALESLERGEPHNVLSVDEENAKWAGVALERMLEAS